MPTISDFNKDPSSYTLYIEKDAKGKEAIKAAKKGIVTWVYANLINPKDYEIEKIIFKLSAQYVEKNPELANNL